MIRQSKLPQKVTFDDYLNSYFSSKLQKQIKELQPLQFIDQKENLILLGNPGVSTNWPITSVDSVNMA